MQNPPRQDLLYKEAAGAGRLSRNAVLRLTAAALAVCLTAHDAFAFTPQRPIAAAAVMPSVRFVLPDPVATVDDGFAPFGAPPRPPQVILFQDAHTNASGQFNLAKALELVVRAEGVDRVYIEGGWGDCSLDALKRAADPRGLRAEAERSVRAGVMHGEEFLSLTSDLDFRIIGAENEAAYRRGLEAYASAARSREAALKYLDRMRRGLSGQERLVFNPELMGFWAARERHHAGGSSFSEWFEALWRQARRTGIYLGAYSHLKTARRASAMESFLDPGRIRREEDAVLGSLPAADRQELEAVRPSAARGSADTGLIRSWYFALEDKAGRSARAYPALRRYIRYLRETRKVSAPAVLKELEALEARVLERLSPEPLEKALVRLQLSAGLLEKLILLRITPEEYDRLKRLEGFADADHLSGFVNARILEREAGYEEAIVLKKSLEKAETAAKRFYAAAAERDTLFLSSVRRHLDEGIAGPAVLIAGGFHTAALKDRLRADGISFVSVLPAVTEETDTVRYERLLLGQRAFLFPEKGAASGPGSAARPAEGPSPNAHRTVPLALNPAELARLTAAAGPPNASPEPSRPPGARMADGKHLQVLESIVTELHRINEMADWLPAVTVFGSARIPPRNPFYRLAYELGQEMGRLGIPGRTGAGPSIMEAVLMGLMSVAPDRPELRQGIRILLPFEQETNPMVGKILLFDHFLTRKRALDEDVIATVALPGGIGSMDEFFEAMRRGRPLALLGESFWWPAWDAFFAAWKRAGIVEPMVDGRRSRPFITDRVSSVMDFIKNSRHVAEHHQHFVTPPERMDLLVQELRSGYLQLHGWPESVTVVGHPAPDSPLIIEAERLASRLWGSDVPVRIASENGLDRRLWERAQADGTEHLFQSVIFKSDRTGPVRLGLTPVIPAARRILIRDESLHQFLTAAHSSAFVFLPGGFGTMNRLFDIVQLMQVKKVERQPIVLLGRDYWQPVLDTLRKIWLESDNIPNMVNPEDMDIFRVADTAEEAEEALRRPVSAARMAQSMTPDSPGELIHGAETPDPRDPDHWKKVPYARESAVNQVSTDGRKRVLIGQVTVTDDGFYQVTDPRGLGAFADRVEAAFADREIPVVLEHRPLMHDTTPTRHFASLEYDYYLAVDPADERLVRSAVLEASRPSAPDADDLHRAIIKALDLVSVPAGENETSVRSEEVVSYLGVRRIRNDHRLSRIRAFFAPLGSPAGRIYLEEEGEMGGYTQEGIHWEKMVFKARFWVPRSLEASVRAYLELPGAVQDRAAGPGTSGPGSAVFRFLSAIRPSIDPAGFERAFGALSESVQHWTGFTNIWSWTLWVRPLEGQETALEGIDPMEIIRRVHAMDAVADPDRGPELIALVLTAAARPSALTPELIQAIEGLFAKHFVWAVNAAGLVARLRPDLAAPRTVELMIDQYGRTGSGPQGTARASALSDDERSHIRVAVGRSLEAFLNADPAIASEHKVLSHVAEGERYSSRYAVVYLGADESSAERAYQSVWHQGWMDGLVSALAGQGIPVTPVEFTIDPETYYHSESHYTMFRSLFFLKVEKRYQAIVEGVVRERAWLRPEDERVGMVQKELQRTAAEQDAPADLAGRMRAAGVQEAPDAVFAAVYREASRVNPDVDTAVLHRLYKEFWGRVSQVDADPRYKDASAEGMVPVVLRHGESRLDTPEDDKAWLDGRSEGTTRIETPLLELVRGRLGMTDAFVTRSLSIENHDSTRHFFVGVSRELLYVPAHARELALLLVTAGEEEFLHAVFGESADLDLRLRRGIRSLGDGIRTSAWGGKESGFLTLKRAGLAFPPGIVLDPELAVELARGPVETRLRMEALIARRLREEGVRLFVDKERVWHWYAQSRDSDNVVLRSNPKVSMPGVLSSSEPTGSLHHGAKTVVDAWDRPQARSYRDRMGLSHEYDQPLIVQKWVSGSSRDFYYKTRIAGDPRSLFLSGVMSTRDPDTGERKIYGRFAENDRGEKLMTQGERGEDLSALENREPWLHRQLIEAAEKLEAAAGPQETEFVVEAGKLWFVQTRPIHFSPQAEIAYLREQIVSGAISEARAIPRIEALQKRLGSRRVRGIASVSADPVARAEASTGGAVEGRLAWDVEEARRMAAKGEGVVLVATRAAREPVLEAIFEFDDVGLIALDYGNSSSHEAALSRHSGIPSLIHLHGVELKDEDGRRYLRLPGGRELVQGDRVVVDGDRGVLYADGTAEVELSGSVTDASHGIDVRSFRAEFSAPYLDADGKVRAEFTEARLLELNAAAQERYDALKTGDDPAAAFRANLEKHFVHDLLTQRRREAAAAAVGTDGARMAEDRSSRSSEFARRASEAIGVSRGRTVTFALWNGEGSVTYARTAESGARAARIVLAEPRAGAFDPEAAAATLDGIPDVPADLELPAWSGLFPVDTRLSEDEVEAQVEFLLEQAAYFARLRPGTRFFLSEDLSGQKPAVRELVRAAVRREPAVFTMGAAPREKGRLTVRVTTLFAPESGVVNFAVEPLSRGGEMPDWASIFAIPVLAAAAAIGSLAAAGDPQAAFDAAREFADRGPVERISRFYAPGAFRDGTAGAEFLSALQGKRPFLAHQRPEYRMVRATRLLQEIRAAVQQVRVMA